MGEAASPARSLTPRPCGGRVPRPRVSELMAERSPTPFAGRRGGRPPHRLAPGPVVHFGIETFRTNDKAVLVSAILWKAPWPSAALGVGRPLLRTAVVGSRLRGRGALAALRDPRPVQVRCSLRRLQRWRSGWESSASSFALPVDRCRPGRAGGRPGTVIGAWIPDGSAHRSTRSAGVLAAPDGRRRSRRLRRTRRILPGHGRRRPEGAIASQAWPSRSIPPPAPRWTSRASRRS